jgi:ATPase subunit of ABC transporter with duplicated ATPase domains
MPQNYLELLDYAQTPVGFLSPSGNKEDRTKAYTFLGSMRYTPEEMNSRIGELSGGQKAKLIILSLILNGFDVLLLDEPTRNFSPLSNPVIRGALSAYGGTLLSVTHDRKFLSEVCTAVYELKSDGLHKVPPDKSGRLLD